MAQKEFNKLWLGSLDNKWLYFMITKYFPYISQAFLPVRDVWTLLIFWRSASKQCLKGAIDKIGRLMLLVRSNSTSIWINLNLKKIETIQTWFCEEGTLCKCGCLMTCFNPKFHREILINSVSLLELNIQYFILIIECDIFYSFKEIIFYNYGHF